MKPMAQVIIIWHDAIVIIPVVGCFLRNSCRLFVTARQNQNERSQNKFRSKQFVNRL